MRFRKSVRIAKGFRLNVSKSGISATVGRPGLSMNFGPKGTYLNAGIPGTGIRTRQRLDAPRSRDSSANSRTVYLQIKVGLDDSGNPQIFDENEKPIKDEATIRKIRRTEEYKLKVAELREKRRKEIVNETKQFVDIYKQTPLMTSESSVTDKLNALTPQAYRIKEFKSSPPDPENIRVELTAKARREVKSILFWQLKKMRKQFVEERIDREIAEATERWKAEKEQFEAAESQRKIKLDKEYLENYERRKNELNGFLHGEQKFVDAEIDAFLEQIALPVDFSIQYQYSQRDGRVDLDIDLPEIEDVPDEKAQTLSSGKLSIKKKTKKEVQEDYTRCVTGLAFFFSGCLFNVSSAVKTISASGYTQRTNPKTGHVEDQYVYSVIFDRDGFSGLQIDHIDPIEAIENFEHRINLTKTLQMKTIQPIEPS